MVEIIRRSPFLLSVFLLALAGGCAREVMINLPQEDPRIVAVCQFRDGQPFRANLSFSQAVYDNSAPAVPDYRKVELTVAQNGIFLDNLFARFAPVSGDLYFESKELAQVGVPYSMTVKIPGYPDATGSSRVPAFVGLDSIQVRSKDLSDIALPDGRRELRVSLDLTLSQYPLQNPYFAFHLTHEIGVYESFTPLVLDYTQQSDSTFFLADGRTLSLLYNIAEPAVLIDANYWNDGHHTLSLIARIPYDPENERPRRIFLEWRTVSAEFYQYHLSVARQGSSLPLGEQGPVYNNIDGGYGNFAGYSAHTYTIELPLL